MSNFIAVFRPLVRSKRKHLRTRLSFILCCCSQLLNSLCVLHPVFIVFPCIVFVLTMDNWLIGVKKKTTKSSDAELKAEKRKSDQNYDQTKRSRTFRKEWKSAYPWLDFSEGEDKMFCTWCRHYKPRATKAKNAFDEGTNNYRLETVRLHSNSEAHIKAAGMADAAKKSPGKSNAEKALQSMNKSVFHRLSVLFRFVFCLNFLQFR